VRPPITFAGTVLEATPTGGGRPVPNLRLKVRDGSRRSGAVGGIELDDIVTDREGRFTIVTSARVLFFQTAPGSTHKFLCDWYGVWLDTSHPLTELSVVPGDWEGLQPIGWFPGTTIYGTVTERVGDQVVAVPGATVSFELGRTDPPATTAANGFFMICSVTGTDQARTIEAQKAGYVSTERQVIGGYHTDINLELIRR
jgi:hypothetical protein